MRGRLSNTWTITIAIISWTIFYQPLSNCPVKYCSKHVNNYHSNYLNTYWSKVNNLPNTWNPTLVLILLYITKCESKIDSEYTSYEWPNIVNISFNNILIHMTNMLLYNILKPALNNEPYIWPNTIVKNQFKYANNENLSIKHSSETPNNYWVESMQNSEIQYQVNEHSNRFMDETQTTFI